MICGHVPIRSILNRGCGRAQPLVWLPDLDTNPRTSDSHWRLPSRRLRAHGSRGVALSGPLGGRAPGWGREGHIRHPAHDVAYFLHLICITLASRLHHSCSASAARLPQPLGRCRHGGRVCHQPYRPLLLVGVDARLVVPARPLPSLQQHPRTLHRHQGAR